MGFREGDRFPGIWGGNQLFAERENQRSRDPQYATSPYFWNIRNARYQMDCIRW
jgi:hypothetical protein